MKIRKQKLFLLILLTTLFSRIDDASCYNYTIDGDSFYLYADGYIGGIQMTLSHDESFTIDLTDDAWVSGYNTQENQTLIIIVIPENSLLFSTTGVYEIVEIIVAANMYEEVAYCPDDNLGELDQEDLESYNVTPPTNNLFSIYPNPFNPVTTIKYIVEKPSRIQFYIYNIYGEQVASLNQGFKPSGTYQLNWEPQLSSGQYFIQLISDKQVLKTSKVVLLK